MSFGSNNQLICFTRLGIKYLSGCGSNDTFASMCQFSGKGLHHYRFATSPNDSNKGASGQIDKIRQ